MNWLDWTVVAVVAVAAATGLRRGLVLTLIRFASTVGALIGGLLLTRPIAAWLDATFHLATRLADLLGKYVKLPPDFARTLVTGLSSGQLWTMLDRSGLPEQYKDAVITWVTEAPTDSPVSLARFIHQGLGALLLNVLTFLILVALARGVLWLLGRGLAKAVHAVGLGPLDHFGGLLVGFAEGAVLTSLVLGLAMPFLGVATFRGVADAVATSKLARHLLGAFYLISPWLRQIGRTIWERS